MVKTKPFASRIGKILIIILVIAVLLGILFYSIYLYSYIESSRVNDLEVTKTKVIQSGQLTEVTEMYHFQDKEAYHILIGLDKDKKSKILFVPLDQKEEEIMMVDVNETLSEERVTQIVLKECQSCNIVTTTPAMVDNKPLWEVTYFDERDRYVIDYLSMYDGSRYEQLRMFRKYKERG